MQLEASHPAPRSCDPYLARTSQLHSAAAQLCPFPHLRWEPLAAIGPVTSLSLSLFQRIFCLWQSSDRYVANSLMAVGAVILCVSVELCIRMSLQFHNRVERRHTSTQHLTTNALKKQ